MKSPFCASVRSALPRILKKSVEPPVVTIAAMILPSFAGSAFSGSPARSTMVASPNEVRSRCSMSRELLFGNWRLTKLVKPAVDIIENISGGCAQAHK